MSKSFQYTLTEPVECMGETITTIKGRTAKAKDMKAAIGAASDFDGTLAVVASVCGLTPATIGELEIQDYTAIIDQMGLAVTTSPKK